MGQTKYLIWRVVGNDLPPRHRAGASLESIRFTLDHEPDFPDCEKRWYLNRIVDPEAEGAIVDLLEKAGAHYTRVPFDPDAYRTRPTRYDKILYAININQARNDIIRDGRDLARYTLPLDSNSFFSDAAWQALVEVVEGYERSDQDRRYFAIPMMRVPTREETLDPDLVPEPLDEPQLMFRSDADLEFDDGYRYGFRDKVELLLRLGKVPGYIRGGDAAREAPHRYSENEALCPEAGYVFRLPTGRVDEEAPPRKGRLFTRERALDRLILELDAMTGAPAIEEWEWGPSAEVLVVPGQGFSSLGRALDFVEDDPDLDALRTALDELARRPSSRAATALYLCAAFGTGNGAVVHVGDPEGGAALCLRWGSKRQGRPPVTHVTPAESPDVSASWLQPVRLLFLDGDRTYADILTDFRRWEPHLEVDGLLVVSAVAPGGVRTGGIRFYRDRLVGHDQFDLVLQDAGLAVVCKKRLAQIGGSG
jgi:hypothetical protein